MYWLSEISKCIFVCWESFKVASAGLSRRCLLSCYFTKCFAFFSPVAFLLSRPNISYLTLFFKTGRSATACNLPFLSVRDHSATLHHTAKGYFGVSSLSFCSYTRKMLQCSCVASTVAMLSQRRSLTHTTLTNSCWSYYTHAHTFTNTLTITKQF